MPTFREFCLGFGGLTIVFLFLWLLFFLTNPLNVFLAFLGLMLMIFIFVNPPAGLLLLILIRPTLDIFTAHSIISLGGRSLNIASFLAIMSIFFTIFIVLFNFKKLNRIPLKFPISIFVLITLASILYSTNFSTSLIEWLRILSIFALYVSSFILIRDFSNFRKLLYTIILSTLIPGLVAFYQFLNEAGMTLVDEGISNRIFGTFAHPNLFAYYLTIPLALTIFISINKEKDASHKLFPILFSIPIFALLMLTYTRGAWLVFLISISILGFLKYRKILLGILLGVILVYFIFPPLHSRVNDLFAYKPGNSVQWRINLWKDGLQYFKEKPLGGHGIGTANQIILERRGPEMGSSDPHNDYLKVIIENGILGIISYLIIIISLLTTLLWKFVKSSSIEEKNLHLLFISITVALYLMSFADNILRNTALQWVFWILLGALFATYQNPRLSDKK